MGGRPRRLFFRPDRIQPFHAFPQPLGQHPGHDASGMVLTVRPLVRQVRQGHSVKQHTPLCGSGCRARKILQHSHLPDDLPGAGLPQFAGGTVHLPVQHHLAASDDVKLIARLPLTENDLAPCESHRGLADLGIGHLRPDVGPDQAQNHSEAGARDDSQTVRHKIPAPIAGAPKNRLNHLECGTHRRHQQHPQGPENWPKTQDHHCAEQSVAREMDNLVRFDRHAFFCHQAADHRADHPHQSDHDHHRPGAGGDVEVRGGSGPWCRHRRRGFAAFRLHGFLGQTAKPERLGPQDLGPAPQLETHLSGGGGTDHCIPGHQGLAETGGRGNPLKHGADFPPLPLV